MKEVLIQYGFSAVANTCGLIAAAWLVWPSCAIGPLTSGGVLAPPPTASQVATVVALMDLGNMVTPVPASYLINGLGRRRVIHLTGFLFVGASLLTIFAEDMRYLYGARLLAGMGKGVAFGVVPVYLTEIAHISIRGTLGSLFVTFVSLGTVYGYVIGACMPYRWMNITNLGVSALFLAVAWSLPETPNYLMMKGQEEAAVKSLARLRGRPSHGAAVRAELEQLKTSMDGGGHGTGAGFWDVARTKARRRALLIVVVTSAVQRFSGISPILAYGSAILPHPGGSGGGLDPAVWMIIFSVVLSLGNYIGAVLSETTGRKRLMIYSALTSAASSLGFAGYFAASTLGADLGGLLWVPYLCLILFGAGWAIGLGIMPPFLPSELFPTDLKSYASSVSSIVLGLASFAVNKVFGEVYLRRGGIESMFLFFAVSSIIFTIFCYYYVIETKGKTFQEIHILLQEATGENKSDIEMKS